jgi:hypothetical protein
VTTGPSSAVPRYLSALLSGGAPAALSDGELLDRFAARAGHAQVEVARERPGSRLYHATVWAYQAGRAFATADVPLTVASPPAEIHQSSYIAHECTLLARYDRDIAAALFEPMDSLLQAPAARQAAHAFINTAISTKASTPGPPLPASTR